MTEKERETIKKLKRQFAERGKKISRASTTINCFKKNNKYLKYNNRLLKRLLKVHGVNYTKEDGGVKK